MDRPLYCKRRNQIFHMQTELQLNSRQRKAGPQLSFSTAAHPQLISRQKKTEPRLKNLGSGSVAQQNAQHHLSLKIRFLKLKNDGRRGFLTFWTTLEHFGVLGLVFEEKEARIELWKRFGA